MSSADETTGQELAACPWWDWKDGMLPRVAPYPGNPRGRHARFINYAIAAPPAGAFPDLTDKATVGVILGELEAAVGSWDAALLMLRRRMEKESLGEAVARSLMEVR